jgi:hypothetical protein
MSSPTGDPPTCDPTDLKAILVQIDRNLAESGKLQAETNKLVAEQRKLMAEEKKLDRDRWLAPIAALVGVIGGALGIASFVAGRLH